MIQTGYAAAATTIIQLSSGEIILSAQNLDYQEARHYSLTARSLDDGLSWQLSNKLDVGGRGHHGGCFEGTLVELKDRVWLCIRTNLDYFWNAYSYDQGKTWTHLEPGMEASTSPSMLKRLQSGRILMVYNTLYPNGMFEYPRRSGLFSEVPASWHREELAIIFSEDEGLTWTQPYVIAKCSGAWLSYPYVFEVTAGRIWVTTMQSELRVDVDENRIIKELQKI